MPDLSGLPALDAAIGLVFLFFLLSTLCSMANESIAIVLGWRAKTLEVALRNLLGDEEVKRGFKDWRADLKRSRAIRKARKRGGAAAAAEVRREQPPRQPADGPRDLTAELFEHWRLSSLVRDPDAASTRRRRPSYVPPRAVSLAIAETIANGPPQDASVEGDSATLWQRTDEQIFEALEKRLAQLPNARARALLHKAAANANRTLDGFRVQVESAFDDAMERASGWYKRKVQLMLILLAAVIAIGGNVDTVNIASSLWHEGPVRSAVAAQATKEPDTATAAQVAAEIEELQLPVGWGANVPDHWYSAIPGWLITIAMLGLGAPFWFDLLSRLARLRGSGVPERPRSLSDTAGTSGVERSTTAARLAATVAAAPAQPAATLPETGGSPPGPTA